MPLLTDAALEAQVLAAQAGDRDAFARLVDATSALVTSITLSETRDVELARDAAQDVYLQVWAGLGTLRQPGSFLPWLRQSARRQARRLSLQRQRQRRAGGPEAEAALAQAADGAPGPGERFLDAERAALVREVLEALPDGARETLVLYYREGHSSAQVARLLGLSDAAVQQRLSRARAAVREEVLQRLGEAVERTAPAAAFTGAVVALLAPRAAQAAAAGGLGAMLQAPKALVAAVAVALAGIAFVATGPSRTPPPAPPVVTIARPPGERPASEAPRPVPPSPAQPPMAEGALLVRVSAAGAPVGGAAVRVYLRLPVDTGTGDSPWRLLAATATDAAGQVRVPAAPGAYLVAARAPGLAAAQRPVVRPSGEPETRLDLPLDAAAVLSGRTVDRAGQPVPIAALVISRAAARGEPALAPPPEERWYATSDARGAFRVEGLAPGDWDVTAEGAGHARTSVWGVRLPRSAPLEVVLGAAGVLEGLVVDAAGRPAAGALVQIAGDEPLEVEAGPSGAFAAEVIPGSYRLSARRGEAAGWLHRPAAVAPGATLKGLTIRLGAPARFTGRVLGPDGAPVVGALIDVSPHRARGLLSRTRSAADGAFASAPLPGGEYDLAASAEGHAPRALRGLVLLEAQRFELTVRLVATAAVEGAVTGEGGAPLAGVRVTGGQRWGSAFGQVDGEAVTGPDGRYRLDGLEPGTVRLAARPPGAALGLVKVVVLAAGEVARADFTVPALGEVAGQVTMEDGSPLPEGIQVQVAPPATFTRSGDTLRLSPGPDGRYAVRLPAGTWQVDAWDDDLRFMTPRGATAKVVAGGTVRADLVLRRRVEEGARVRLLVLEPGGAPSRGAIVEGRAPPDMAMRTMTDDEGRSEPALIAEGGKRLAMEVTARNGGRRAGPILVPAEQEAATIQLEPGATLRGRVEGAGSPVTGFALRVELPIRPPASFGDAEERRFSGDAFLLADVPAGEVTLLATAEDGRVGRVAASLRPGETTEVAIPLAAAGRLRVRVVDQAGRAEPGVYLAFGGRMIDADPTGFHFDPALVKDGSLTVPDLAAGRLAIEVGARCFEPLRREVEIRPGETTDLGEVRLVPLPPEKCGR